MVPNSSMNYRGLREVVPNKQTLSVGERQQISREQTEMMPNLEKVCLKPMGSNSEEESRESGHLWPPIQKLLSPSQRTSPWEINIPEAYFRIELTKPLIREKPRRGITIVPEGSEEMEIGENHQAWPPDRAQNPYHQEEVNNTNEVSRAIRRRKKRVKKNSGKWTRLALVDLFIAELLMNDANAMAIFQKFKFDKILKREP